MHQHSRLNLHSGALETANFIRAHAAPPLKLLDVGCGDGRQALALKNEGYVVTAIDSNHDAVQQATSLGLTTSQSDILDFEPSEKFDVILFARSLHHMPLNEALEHAKRLLTRDGVIVIDDFGAELVDEKTALWFYGMKSFLSAAGSNPQCRGPQLEDGKIPADPVAQWRDHHFGHHHVEPLEKVRAAMVARVHIQLEESVPYLYRYFLDDVNFDQGVALRMWEERAANIGAINRVGYRAIARASV